ncbi:MAG: lipid-binding SYLF domain-containing protein [Gemmatimonadetes bacterium]|nr:lipid-binding SYLF domain-containing protein [Gemmatimonadota bacterium]
MKRLLTTAAGLLILASLVTAPPAAADSETKAEKKYSKEMSEDAERAMKAGTVLDEMMNADDHAIPEDLLERATGIAVIPHVVKGAMGVGGRYGKGLVATRGENGIWHAPSFVHVGGASWGLQFGVEAADLILVFTEADGVEALMEDKLKLGGSAGVAAGPLGRHAEIGMNVTMDSGIYSYSRSKGLFAGVAIEGAVLTIDDDANARVYGEDKTAEQIVDSHAYPAPVKPFMDAVKRHSPAIKIRS